MENIFKSFQQLPGGEEEPEKEESLEPVQKREKFRGLLTGDEMLGLMELDMESKEKIDLGAFFELAVKRAGYIPLRPSESDSRAVILMSTFKDAFGIYYGYKGAKKNDQFVKAFDLMHTYKQIDYIPHAKGKDAYLALPLKEE